MTSLRFRQFGIPQVSKAKISFLDLPSEIRFRIYQECLISHDPILLFEWIKSHALCRNYELSPALLRTNKTIEEEASTVLYSQNVFCLVSCDPRNTSAATRSTVWDFVYFTVRSIGLKNLEKIRFLSMFFSDKFGARKNFQIPDSLLPLLDLLGQRTNPLYSLSLCFAGSFQIKTEHFEIADRLCKLKAYQLIPCADWLRSRDFKIGRGLWQILQGYIEVEAPTNIHVNNVKRAARMPHELAGEAPGIRPVRAGDGAISPL